MQSRDIAIIGISTLLPGAKNLAEYWTSLLSGKNSIREISPDRWDNTEYYSPHITTENKMVSKWAGLLEEIRGFDFQFFNLLPEEVKSMDPQSRLLLQEVWHCLENAGVPPRALQEGITSVYVGAFSLDYLQLMARTTTVEAYACHGNYPCMIANRISHFLNLKGTSFSIDAACASSLVALHEAKIALRQGSCDYAIVGASNLICHPWHHIAFSKCRMLSPDGQCKTFDKDANGYVRGEGVVALLMTTKERALKEGHPIHAIVKGSAVNHCGGARAISTPNFYAQKAVIEKAMQDANVLPEEIGYVETHGTGTALGDAIECHALGEVFAKNETLYIGSVKTNIGHLEAAAGLAGVAKVSLMLQQGIIPRHLNLISPNPIIDFDRVPLKIPLSNLPWVSKIHPRVGGISSFGFGGVNGHVILEEFSKNHAIKKRKSPHAFPLLFSAKSKQSLEQQILHYKEYAKLHSLHVQDISYTLLKGRQHFACRKGFLSNDKMDLSTPIPSPSFPKGARIFSFGQLPLGDLSFLNVLHEEEKTHVNKRLSPQALFAYLIGKLLLNLNVQPLIFLGEGEGHQVAQELSLQDPKGQDLLSLEQCQQISQAISSIHHIDERLLFCVKALCDQQFAFKKILSAMDKLLHPYGLSILPLDSVVLDSQQSAILNFVFLRIIDECYKKYQIPNHYRSLHPVLDQLNKFIQIGTISLQEALTLLHHPSSAMHVLKKNPSSLESLCKEHLVLTIGKQAKKFPQQLEYLGIQDPCQELFHLLITLWLAGDEIRWDLFVKYFYPQSSIVDLPNYFFEPTPFWCLQV